MQEWPGTAVRSGTAPEVAPQHDNTDNSASHCREFRISIDEEVPELVRHLGQAHEVRLLQKLEAVAEGQPLPRDLPNRPEGSTVAQSQPDGDEVRQARVRLRAAHLRATSGPASLPPGMGEEWRQGEVDHQATGLRSRHRDPRGPSLVADTKETRRRRPAISVATVADTRRQVRPASLRAHHQHQSAQDLHLSGRPGALRLRQIQRRHQLPQRPFHASYQL